MARKIVVDGANVAYAEKTDGGKPRVGNLIAMQKKLEREGYEPIVIIDAATAYEVDDRDQLEGLLDKQTIRQAPAATDADYFVLKTAENYDALVVTNDQYEDYRKEFPWIRKRRLPFMIVHGEVELYEPGSDGQRQ